MLSMGVQTFRERWTLFVGTLLAVALGVGLTVSSVMLLRAVDQVAAATPEQREMAAASKAFVGLTLSLAIVLSTFIISSTLAFTVTERRRELALLRLSGASRRQVRLLLVGEAGVVGLLGAVIGVPLGLVLAGVHRWSLTRLGLRGEALSARVDTVAVLVGLGTGVGLALVAALVCSRRAVRARPLEALQDVGDAARVMTLGRWCWGMLFLGSTAAAVVGMQVSNDLMVAVGLGILVIFTGSVGLQQLSPLVVPLVGRVVGVVMRRHVEAELAQASLVDARRRTATTAGPVILLVGLVGGLFGVLATQTKATELDTAVSSRAQLVITSQGADLERIRSVPGVRVAAPVSEVRLPAQVRWQRRGQEGEATPGRPVVQVTDPAAYRQVATPRMSQGSLDSFTDGTVVVGENDDPASVHVSGRCGWAPARRRGRCASSPAPGPPSPRRTRCLYRAPPSRQTSYGRHRRARWCSCSRGPRPTRCAGGWPPATWERSAPCVSRPSSRPPRWIARTPLSWSVSLGWVDSMRCCRWSTRWRWVPRRGVVSSRSRGSRGCHELRSCAPACSSRLRSRASVWCSAESSPPPACTASVVGWRRCSASRCSPSRGAFSGCSPS